MHKGRRKGIALPSGRSLSFTLNDFPPNNKHDEMCIAQNNTGQSTEGTLGDVTKKVQGRKCSVSSVTLPLGPERRRKNSFQIGSLTLSRTQGFAQQHEIESHFTVIVGAPAVGKTGIGWIIIHTRLMHISFSRKPVKVIA